MDPRFMLLDLIIWLKVWMRIAMIGFMLVLFKIIMKSYQHSHLVSLSVWPSSKRVWPSSKSQNESEMTHHHLHHRFTLADREGIGELLLLTKSRSHTKIKSILSLTLELVLSSIGYRALSLCTNTTHYCDFFLEPLWLFDLLQFEVLKLP